MRTKRASLRAIDLNEIMQRLIDTCIKPHANWFVKTADRGEFVAMLFEPAPLVIEVSKTLGRRRDAKHWALPPEAVRSLRHTDHVANQWFATAPRADHVKIFVLAHSGSTLLLNFEPGKGYYLEAGSLDAEVSQ